MRIATPPSGNAMERGVLSLMEHTPSISLCSSVDGCGDSKQSCSNLSAAYNRVWTANSTGTHTV